MSYGEKNHIEAGQIILSITGRLTKLFEPSTKERPGKPGEFFTVQNGEINVSGDILKLNLYGEGSLPLTAKGREITIKSHQGPKGINGVKYKPFHSNKLNTTVESIEASEKAEIYIDGQPFTGGALPAPQLHTNAPSKPPATKSSPSATDTLEDLLIRIDRVHSACNAIVQETYPDISDDMRQAYVASYFIEANRNGAMNLPSKYPATKPAKSGQDQEVEGDDIPW